MKRTKVILAVATLAVAGLALPASASAASASKAQVVPVHELQGRTIGHVAHSSCGEMMADLV